MLLQFTTGEALISKAFRRNVNQKRTHGDVKSQDRATRQDNSFDMPFVQRLSLERVI